MAIKNYNSRKSWDVLAAANANHEWARIHSENIHHEDIEEIEVGRGVKGSVVLVAARWETGHECVCLEHEGG